MTMTPAVAEGRGLDLPLFERILCAVDLEQPTPAALSLASFFARGFGASLEALYVGPAETSTDPEVQRRLSEIVDRLNALGTTAKLASGAPAQAIVERACSRRCDLIVLGARQRSDLGWQFRDDVVRDVSALADCATLTVHERDTPEAIQRILVPVDLGPGTENVLDWACAIALCFGAKLQLLHVVSRERRTSSGSDRAALEQLEASMSSLGVLGGSDVIVAGGATNGIESYNDRGEFDLVVMGLGGASERSGRLIRGVVATLRNRMSVPVLAVPGPSFDATRPRARAKEHQICSAAGAPLSA